MLNLYERNKAHLGFLPHSAFTPFIERNEILVAHNGENVKGYLLFRRSTADRTIRVTHLCVADANRRQGIATKLIDELKRRFHDFIRITARCRKDFDSWHFWKSHSGFSEGREIVGRKKSGSLLTEFFWEPNELPLFRSLESPRLPKVVIDANVFFDLYQPDRNRHEESCGLLEDWLSGELELCVTTELKEDANRSGDPAELLRIAQNLKGWTLLESAEHEISKNLTAIERILGAPRTVRDVSDHRHLAIAIANGAAAFVTRDSHLMAHSDLFFESSGMSICRPSEIILEFDVLQDNDRYQYRELEKTGLKVQRFSGENVVDFSQFREDSCERVAPIRAAWHNAVANLRAYDVLTIVDHKGSVFAVAIAKRVNHEEVTVSLLRVRLCDVGTRLGQTLIRYLVGQVRSLFGNPTALAVTENAAYLTDAFVEFGFFRTSNSWKRISIAKVLRPDEFLREVASLSNSGVLSSSQAEMASTSFTDALSRHDAREILRLEELFAPLKLDVPFVQNYIVPIQPRWAKDLFDPAISPGELWETPIEKVLNPHSAYYKSSGGFRKELECCRILWYVSEDASFPLAKHLRASSIMIKRVTGEAKELFRRYRRLGIYEYMHVRDTPAPREVIEFCGTEIWENPIPYAAAIEYLKARGVATNNFVTAQEIPQDVFLAFYGAGFACRSNDAPPLDPSKFC